MKKKFINNRMSIAAGLVLMSCTAHSNAATTLLAGFDDAGSDNTPFTDQAADFTASGIIATVTANGRSLASTDGTYGSTFTGASTDGNDFSFRANQANSFTITNGTGEDVVLDMFHLDFDDNGGTTFFKLIYVSGSLTGVTDGTEIATINSGFTNPIGDSDWDDFDISLTGLADFTLANGESATFSITEDGGSGNVFFDNVGISGTVGAIPEPSTTALLGLGGLALILRRRK